ncbi:hypothetical protein ACQPYK_08100 [Streptosporangium sp. CA-135522]|uniref:hypothetical protein n=1 Tax=Streptosporangium sp. CA-135522 TaxID=3240072 RepID=UPI003D8C5566
MLKHMVAMAALAVATIGPVTAWAETAPAVTDLPAVMADYEKSGGFAGIHHTITIDRYGKAHGVAATTAADFQLTAEELQSLRRGLGGISTWDSSQAGCDVSDHFTYTLSYRGRHATRCHELPSDWRPAIAQFEEMVARHLTIRSTAHGH